MSSCNTKKIEDIFHARYDHVRAPNGVIFMVDPDVVINEFEMDIEYLTMCQEHTPELVNKYLDLLLDIYKT